MDRMTWMKPSWCWMMYATHYLLAVMFFISSFLRLFVCAMSSVLVELVSFPYLPILTPINLEDE
jgi:hypothetical protein